jgi:hypothetical protein
VTSFIKLAPRASRTVLTSALVLAGVTLTTGNAFAFSMRVQWACASDYYSHCSQYGLTNPKLRSCMRAVGSGLSKGCVDALVKDGEVSAAEVARRRGDAQTAAK